MIAEHALAIMNRLRAAPTFTTWPAADGQAGSTGKLVPDGTLPPYVAARVTTAPMLGDSLTSRSDRYIAYAYLQCAGASDIASQVVAGQAIAQLLDFIPTIPGRTVFPIRCQPTQPPPVVDETVKPPVWTTTVVMRLETGPG